LSGVKVIASHYIEAGITFSSQTFSAADGAFELIVQTNTTNRIQANKSGYHSATLLSVPVGKSDCLIVLNIISMGLLTGRVTDALSGEPIEKIILDNSAVNAPGGYFELERAVSPNNQSLLVSAAGYTSRRIDFMLQEPKTIDLGGISLSRGAVLHGLVFTEEDDSVHPVSSAVVTVQSSGNLTRTVRSNSNGTFTFEGLSPGTSSIRVSADGFNDFHSKLFLKTPAPEDPSTGIHYLEIKLNKEEDPVIIESQDPVFRGSLRVNGQALPAGVTVELWKKVSGGLGALHTADNDFQNHHWTTNTGDQGDFEFQVPAGAYFLHVQAYHLYPAAVTVNEESNDAVIVDVPGTTAVSGKIIYADGTPVANTTIHMHSGEQDYPIQAYHTDANGNYSIPHLAKRKYVLSIIKSVADQSAQYGHEFTVNAAPQQTVDLRFPSMTASIHGRLTDELGNPKSGVQIGVEFLDNPNRSFLAGWVKTDNNGYFNVPRLEAGRHVLRTAWTSDEVVFSDIFALQEGESKELNLIAPKVEGKRISGHLVAADGGPLNGSFVFAVNNGGQRSGNFFASFRWEYSSGFSVYGLKPGTYTLVCTAIGCRKKTVDVTVQLDIQNFTVTMERE